MVLANFSNLEPKLLSMLENIETASHETSNVPSGKGPVLFNSSILLIRSAVSLMKDGNLRVTGCR